jgi:hypothetical protein
MVAVLCRTTLQYVQIRNNLLHPNSTQARRHARPRSRNSPSSRRVTFDLEYGVVAIGVVAVLRQNQHGHISANRVRTARVHARRGFAIVAAGESRRQRGSRRVQRERADDIVALAASRHGSLGAVVPSALVHYNLLSTSEMLDRWTWYLSG